MIQIMLEIKFQALTKLINAQCGSFTSKTVVTPSVSQLTVKRQIKHCYKRVYKCDTLLLYGPLFLILLSVCMQRRVQYAICCINKIKKGSVYTSGTRHIIPVTACREPDMQEERT